MLFLAAYGMAPHELRLRVGAPIVFLRNLNREQGMMNGTRGIILALRKYTVQAIASLSFMKVPCEWCSSPRDHAKASPCAYQE